METLAVLTRFNPVASAQTSGFATGSVSASVTESAQSANSLDSIETEEVPQMLRPVAADGTLRLGRAREVLKDKVWWGDVAEEQTYRNGEEYVSQWPAVALIPEDGRVSGDPLPFSMGADGYVGSVLLVILAVATLLLARSSHYLLICGKQFFSTRRRENLFNDISDARMQGKYFFFFMLCVSLGVLMYSYQRSFYFSDIYEVSPYLMLGLNIAAFCVACLIRTLLYAFVNTIFFDRESNAIWMDAYHLLGVFSSVLFLSLALLVVFYELDFSNWQILLFISVGIVEIFLIFKTYSVFFEGGLGFLHLILYLCTLEFLPLLILWKGMIWGTQELTKLV